MSTTKQRGERGSEPRQVPSQVHSAPGSIPLSHRLPNPPADFCGRVVEAAALSARLASRPLTLVLGPLGVGKTALVTHGLAAHQAAPGGPRPLYVSVARSAPPEDVRLVLGRAFFRAGLIRDQLWRGALSEVSALSAVLLDLAETLALVVVLDDAEHADKASLRELQHVLVRYASKSRWVILNADSTLDAQVSGEALMLSPMSHAELELLAARRAPGLPASTRDRAILASAGSPWKLIQQLTAALLGVVLGPSGGISQLDTPARDLLSLLCRAGVGLSVAQLEALGAEVSWLERLSERGLVERESTGTYRAHDLVCEEFDAQRLSLPSDPTGGSLERKLADLLAASEEPEQALAGMRLWGELGLHRERATLLASRAHELIPRGYGRSLWQQLAHESAPELETWRLRIAVEAASAAELGALSQPNSQALSDRLLWGRVLCNRGRFDQALQVGQSVLSEVEADSARAQPAELAFEAALLVADCYSNLSEWDAVVKVLSAHPGREPRAIARRGLLLARNLTLAGSRSEALAALAEVQAVLAELDEYIRAETTCSLAAALYELGRVAEAGVLLDQVDAGRAPALYSEQGRHALFQRATLEHARGDLDQCRERLAMLWPFVGAASVLRPEMLLLEARCRYFAGELEGLDALLLEVSEHGRRIGNDNLTCVAENYRLLLAIDEGRAASAATRECPVRDPNSLNARMFHLYQLRARMHLPLGEPARISATPELVDQIFARFSPREFPKVGVVTLGVAAETALLAGDAPRALQLADEAIQLALELDLGVALGSTRLGRCEVLACLERRLELTKESAALAAVAEQLGARAECDARFFEIVAVGQKPDLPSMAALAGMALVAPVTSRRARALFGVGAALSAYDQLVVDAVRKLQAFSSVSRVQSATAALAPELNWSTAWGVFAPERQVWLPGGRSVDLSTRELLFRLLRVLLDHQGEASKEQLVLEAWDEREYHPLRHDNRLQAAVRKLRRAVEEDPSRPTRFVTTDAGYAFGDPTFWWSGA